MKFLKDLLTEPNNETYCLVKTIAATGTMVFFGAASLTLLLIILLASPTLVLVWVLSWQEQEAECT